MNRYRVRSAMGLLALTATVVSGILSGAASAQTAGSSARLTGRVQSMDRDGSSFVLDHYSANERITVRTNGALITHRNRPGYERYRLSDLRRGEVVDVFGTWLDGGTVRAERIERSNLVAPGYRNDRREDRRNDRRDDGRNDRRDDQIRDRRRDRDRRNDRYDRDVREGRVRMGLNGFVRGTTGNLSRNLQVEADGRNYTVEVPRDIPVSRDNRSVSIHELREGDRVRVRGEWRGDRLTANRVEAFTHHDRDDEDDWDDEDDRRSYTGVIEGLYRTDERFRLRTSSRTYDVDARDADVRDGGRRYRFSDLRVGDRVRVYADDVRNSRIVADRIELTDRRNDDHDERDDRDDQYGRTTVGGTISNVDTYNRTFRVRMGLGSVLVRAASNADVIDRNGDRLRFQDLRSGNRVRVTGTRTRTSNVFVAERVEVY